MPILSEWYMDVMAVNGGTGTVNIHFDRPRNVSVQVAMGACGGSPPYVEVGISAFAQNFGGRQPIGTAVFGSYARWLYREQVTDLWLTARTFDSWVAGSARILEWA